MFEQQQQQHMHYPETQSQDTAITGEIVQVHEPQYQKLHTFPTKNAYLRGLFCGSLIPFFSLLLIFLPLDYNGYRAAHYVLSYAEIFMSKGLFHFLVWFVLHIIGLVLSAVCIIGSKGKPHLQPQRAMGWGIFHIWLGSLLLIPIIVYIARFFMW